MRGARRGGRSAEALGVKQEEASAKELAPIGKI